MQDISAATLRAEIARRKIVKYRLAAKVGVYPGTFGMMLSGARPMPERIARRIAAEIERWRESTDAETMEEG